KEINGWIKFKEGNGNYKYFKYYNEYIVANAAVAISPDKMNVFYAVVENPITVSSAGVAPDDFVVIIDGANGTMRELGNGKYMVSVKGANTTTLTVYQKTNEGLKKQGTPQVFRVKKFPDPPLKILGKSIVGNADFSLAEARAINTLGLDLSSFDFSGPFK